MRIFALAVLLALALGAANADPISAVSGLITRMLGQQYLSSFSFQVIPPVGKLDAFEFETVGGKLVLRGSSGVAMVRGPALSLLG